MSSMSVSSQNNAPSKTRKTAGVLTGLAVGGAPMACLVYDTFAPIKSKSIPGMQMTMDYVMPPIDTFDNTKKIAETIIKEQGLADKGVKLFIANNTPESVENLDNILKTEKPKVFVKKIKTMLQNGLNACFHPKSKNVIINDEHAFSSVFHELGHAKNYTSNNIFLKALTKSRCLTPMNVSVLAPIALGVSMFHKVDNNKPKEEKTKTERALDFISNNGGKLTLLSYLPIVAEEGLASIRGINMAKKHLNPSQLTKLKGNYLKAFGTYTAAAVLVSGAVGLASMLKKGISKENSKAA